MNYCRPTVGLSADADADLLCVALIHDWQVATASISHDKFINISTLCCTNSLYILDFQYMFLFKRMYVSFTSRFVSFTLRFGMRRLDI